MQLLQYVLRATLVLAPLAIGFAGCSPGGCPWTQLSGLTVTPKLDCLEIRAAGNGDPGSTGGCVNPNLVGVNRCAEPLVFPASARESAPDAGGDLTIAPGASFNVELEAERVTTRVEGDTRYFHVSATLGSTPVSIDLRGELP